MTFPSFYFPLSLFQINWKQFLYSNNNKIRASIYVSSAIVIQAKLLCHKFLWILHNNILWFYLTYLYHSNVSISVATISLDLKWGRKMKNNKMKIFIFRNERSKKKIIQIYILNWYSCRRRHCRSFVAAVADETWNVNRERRELKVCC
jgi:hypothetical protein